MRYKKRLTVRLRDGKIGCLTEYTTHDLAKKLADYEDAEDNGLLHTAPLKNGTPIYRIQESVEDMNSCEVVKDSYLYNVTEYLHGEMDKDWFVDENKANEVAAKWKKTQEEN